MTKNLREAISRIRTATPILNQITDDAISMVKAVESFLNEECSVGLPIDILVSESRPKANPADGKKASVDSVSLAYRRVNGKFRIAVICETWRVIVCKEVFESELLVNAEITPWLDATRELKLETFVKLPDLLTSISEYIESVVTTTKQTSEAVRQMTEAMGGVKTYDDVQPEVDHRSSVSHGVNQTSSAIMRQTLKAFEERTK